MTVQQQLTADLWILDALLTGKDPRSGRGDPNKLIDHVRFAQGELHYLSDGGYSRVFVRDDKLFLTGSPRIATAPERWDDNAVQTVRNRIEQTLREFSSD